MTRKSLVKFSVITYFHHFSSFSSGSLIGIRSKEVHCEHRSLSERSSGDGGSDKDGHLAMSDEGGSATEEIYATISRRKRSKMTIHGNGQLGYLWDTTQDNKEENNGEYDTELYEDSAILGMRECDGQEREENTEDAEEKQDEDRKISSCSTFSNETLDELSQRFPANLSGLSEQYRDISTETSDIASDSVERVLKPSHIRHLVLNKI